jgi:hypothetical protein
MYSAAPFVAAVAAMTGLCACASSRHTAAQDAIDSCIDTDRQTGWVYLPGVPANADALRAVMVKANPALQWDVENQEYWFSRTDGQLMRCTLHPQFVTGGCPAICGAFTNIFTLRAGVWTVENGPLIMCHAKAR